MNKIESTSLLNTEYARQFCEQTQKASLKEAYPAEREKMNGDIPCRLSKRQHRYISQKRLADCLISILFLLMLMLPFLIVAFLQKVFAPKEPVFFVQERIGLNGKKFKIIKFRTMAENDVCHTKKVPAFSCFLRKTSIDELPQLLNVFKGDMALVGPRPLIPQEQPIQSLRMKGGIYCVRPGITGWAQINGRALLDDTQKYTFDREYVENVSLRFDLLILLKSVSYILKQKDVEQTGS